MESVDKSQMVSRVPVFQHDQALQARSLGVLPWCRDQHGEPLVLLGREACAASRRWAPFEGSAKPGETYEEGAAREYVEESLAVVPFSHGAPRGPFVTVTEALEDIRAGAYSHRVQLRYHVRMRSMAWKETTTLVTEIDYDPQLETRFISVRIQLVELARFSCTLHKLRAKIEHSGGLYGRILTARGRRVRVVDVLSMGGFRETPDGIHLAACVRCSDLTDPQTPHFADVELELSYSTCLYTVIHFIHLSVFRGLAAGVAAGDMLGHPAGRLVYDVHGELTGLRVNTDYLEKDRVKYWTRNELGEMMNGRGHINGGIFRSSTCALVEVLLDRWDEWFVRPANPAGAIPVETNLGVQVG
jgi:hypothetical protein